MTSPWSGLTRQLAASLTIAVGVCLIGALWFRDLDALALSEALLGAIYLIIGIGLTGQSRFTLFVAIVLPAGDITVHLLYTPYLDLLPQLQARLAIDAVVSVCSTLALWKVRHDPSV